MGIVAIILGGLAGYAAGAIWYMTFGKRWMAALGLREEDVRQRRSGLPFAIAAAASLVAAVMMRHVFVASGISGAPMGLVAGLGIGAFLAAPWILTHYAFAGQPRALWWIDCGHTVFACALMGLVLGLF